MKKDIQRPYGFATRAIHEGYDPRNHQGALTPPIYTSSTYAFASIREGMEIFAGEREGFIYSRVGNPTTALLEARLASLEGEKPRWSAPPAWEPSRRCCGPCWHRGMR
jgi:O-acetylhomoserine/O-acetylserine sulfhydrylase-like pyridoxal-dependent enzyme